MVPKIFDEKVKGIFTIEECIKIGVIIREEWNETNQKHL